MRDEITLESFLRRDYENERECEFVDGYLEERTGGEFAHSSLHGEIAFWFSQREKEWNIQTLMSYSMWIAPTRIRVPDIVVLADNLKENIRQTPPLLVVEVLAPEDTLAGIFTRCRDFLNMGVQHVWLLDPIDRVAFTYIDHFLNLVDTPRLTIPGSPLYLDLIEVFAALD